jgi:hypothetical protein
MMAAAGGAADDRVILHLDIDAFYAQVCTRRRPLQWLVQIYHSPDCLPP